jgi:hypothetical protein
MATLKQKLMAECRVRELIEEEGVPNPDRVEYGYGCIRLFWMEPKVVLIVDIDDPGLEPDETESEIDLSPWEGWEQMSG